MNCPHNFKAGHIIVFRGGGSCDQCGGPIVTEGHWGYYLGDNSRGHVFLVQPRVPCHGCRQMLSKIHIPCGEQWRVPELEKIHEIDSHQV